MASSALLKLVCTILVCMVVITQHRVASDASDASDGCITVTYTLLPCFDYLTGVGQDVTGDCCTAMGSIAAMGNTTDALQATCTCMIQIAAAVNSTLAEQLPSQCGVTLPYDFSPDANCTQLSV